jgi:hypothetical protein
MKPPLHFIPDGYFLTGYASADHENPLFLPPKRRIRCFRFKVFSQATDIKNELRDKILLKSCC